MTAHAQQHHELTPKFISMLQEGYRLSHFKADALAGLTVAIVALPLSMAIAIGAGAKPEQGLYAAMIGGFLISLLGGSYFQIGGPAGAFIVLIATTITTYGYNGLMLATIMAGMLMVLIGYMRLGSYIKYIPHAVTLGFTVGIGLIIFCGELRDLFGIQLSHEPPEILAKLNALWEARASTHSAAVLVSLSCIVTILLIQKINTRLPSLLVAVAGASLVTWLFDLPIETIGTRFGEVPRNLPLPHLPELNLVQIIAVAPNAMAIALLGSIESLLSAVVADGMSGQRHRPNCELVAQGWANIASALCGGLCVTGTIARTATNVRAHAHGPVAGMCHAAFIALFIVIAAPLAAYIPLAALAAVLALVAYNMIELREIIALARQSRAEAFICASTIMLTLFRDLATGIAVGVTMGALLFMHRMAQMTRLDTQPLDDAPEYEHGPELALYRLSGPFFFGAAAGIAAQMDLIGRGPKVFVLDMADVPLLDEHGAHILAHFAKRARQDGAYLCLMAARPAVRASLKRHGLDEDQVHFIKNLQDAQILSLLGR